MSKERLYLVEAHDFDPVAGAEVVRRYSSGGHGRLSYVTKPGDTPAHARYLPHVKVPANYSRRLRGTGGRAEVGAGEVILTNPAGTLDGLFDAVDGRPLRVLTVAPGAPYASAEVVLTATMEQAEYGWRQVRLKLRDRVAELAAAPVETREYAGTCVNGTIRDAQGRPEDIQGQPWPTALGPLFSVPAVPVDVFNLMYQAHGGALVSIAAKDRGVALTLAGDYPTLAALYAATTGLAGSGADIEDGQYATCLAEGYFRLGGQPDGVVTADLVQGATPADRTAAAMILFLLDRAGWPTADINDAAVAALAAAAPYELGLWVDSRRDVTAALDQVTESVGAWWTIDRLGRFTCGLDGVQPGPVVTTLTDRDILDQGQGLERIAADLPAWSVAVEYRPNWRVLQGSDLAEAVLDVAERAALGQEWRTATASDAGVQAIHKLARKIVRRTLLVHAADAEAEAARILALESVPRPRYLAPLDSARAKGLDMGSKLAVRVGRFGLAAGVPMAVVGVTEDTARGRATLEVRA